MRAIVGRHRVDAHRGKYEFGYPTRRRAESSGDTTGGVVYVRIRICAGVSALDGALKGAAKHTDLVADLRCPVVIGRGAETDALLTALGTAEGGSGSVMFLVGEAGIGKSRLAAELAAEARARGAAVLTGRAVPAGGASPYRPLTEALLQALRSGPYPADDALAPWRAALRVIVPALDSAETQDDGKVVSGGDYSPAVRGEAVLQLLRRLAGPGGSLLLVLEDLHWADPDTLAVLEYLSDNLAAEPVLCVATCRDEPASPASELAARLRARRAATRIALGRLSAAEVAAIVRACLPLAADDVITRVQRLADGIPFLVEESLAAPGVPSSFAGGVRVRLAGLTDSGRLVLHTAALFGRQFDWRLLLRATGLPADAVAGALEHGVRLQLLAVDDGVFRFRHMLTREAVAAELLPPRRVALAARALAALEAAEPELAGAAGDLAAELAIQADEPGRAGLLLTESGRSALGRGALATAASVLRRAADLLADPALRAEAETLLVEALALAGRVDEAMQIGDRLIAQLTPGGGAATRRAGIHLKLAHAAVDGTRWTSARRHIDIVRDLLAAEPESGLDAQVAVLDAEIALADDEAGRARALAESALASTSASPEIRCRALELLGRVRRVNDLDGARAAFEQALSTADTAGLALWRLRALHELGTIEMFDRAGDARLSQAQRLAEELGATSTGAVIDLQLTAAAMFRFDLDAAERHAESALAASTRLSLGKTRATVLVFHAEICALRRDAAGMERYIALACAAAPGDPEIEGSALAGARAMLALLNGDMARAMDVLRRGIAVLDSSPPGGPAHYRGLWPLLLAARGERTAAEAISRARAIGLTVNRVNRGLLGYADAILAGRVSDGSRATDLAAAADLDLQHYPVWADLARLVAAEPALAQGWGQPRSWLEAAATVFGQYQIEPLAARCWELLAGPRPSRWSRLGITDRQADVLRLVAAGISNKEIAARLHLSPRTVEKHVENLLRITAAQSRTQLVVLVGPEED
jgi:DNA-binding CsgD family transcriptional regulator